MSHLNQLLHKLPTSQSVGVIGASMGGSVAVELARRHADRVCDLLLRHRADPNALNGAGMGPLSYAVLGEGHSHPRVVALLSEHGARDCPGDDGMTCLMVAALMGEMDVVRMLCAET